MICAAHEKREEDCTCTGSACRNCGLCESHCDCPTCMICATVLEAGRDPKRPRYCSQKCAADDDVFICTECDAVRTWPPAGYGEWTPDQGNGDPLCGPYTRKGMLCPEYAHLVSDGSEE